MFHWNTLDVDYLQDEALMLLWEPTTLTFITHTLSRKCNIFIVFHRRKTINILSFSKCILFSEFSIVLGYILPIWFWLVVGFWYLRHAIIYRCYEFGYNELDCRLSHLHQYGLSPSHDLLNKSCKICRKFDLIMLITTPQSWRNLTF